MARDIESLVLTMSADISKLSKQLDRAQGKFDSTANAIERRQRQLDRNLAILGREAANFARPVQLAATVALGAITAMSYNAAKRAEAVSGAFEQTFRDMPVEAAKATSTIADDFKRLETDIKDNFTQLQSVMVALGVEATQSLGIVDALQRRSLDMAAFKDVSDADAFRAVISGITGETEPLKKFGVVLNDTALSAELLRLGFKGKAKDASEAAKAIARANIILQKTKEMHGQVAREADTVAAKEKELRTEFMEAAETLGKQFLPAATKVLEWAAGALTAFNNLPSGVQAAGLAMLALVAAGGPIMSVIKGLQAVIKAAIAARAAMLAIGGSAGVGVAGGTAAGLTAGTLARVAPVAAGAVAVGVGTASFAPAPERDEAAVQRDLAIDRQRLNRLREQGASARRLQGAERRVANRLAELSALQKKADAIEAKAEDEVSAAINAALSNAGDFGLTPDLQAGNGGSGGGGRGSGRAEAAAAQRQAELRDQLGLQLAIDIARANGDDAAVKAAERRQELARLTAQYEDAGYANAASRAQEHLTYLNTAEDAAEAREKAEREVDIILEGRRRQLEREADYQQLISDRLFDRLGYEAELARVTGDEQAIRAAERRLFIEERTLEILRLKLAATEAEARALAGREYDTLSQAEAGRDMASNIVSVLRADNIWEEAGRRFKDAAWDGVEDLLSQILGSFSQSLPTGGGGNWLQAIAGLFTGGRQAATGRSVTAGYPVLTGERRPEVFVPSVSGTIIPNVNQAMSRMQTGQGARAQPVIVQLAIDEGGLFVPRVQAISGSVAVQTTTMGVATVQDQQRATSMRRRQSLVG